MGDTLSLLFELDVDGRPGAAGLLRFRKDIAAAIEFARRAFTQPFPSAVFEKATIAAQKLAVQSLELTNRQERARQAAERLAQAQQRLILSSQQITAALSRAPNADAHVRFFRETQKAATDADSHVKAFKAAEATLAKAPLADAHVRAFKAIQKGAEDADKHVQFFKANERALSKAPQMDAHVQAFRSIEKSTKQARVETERFEAQQRRLERSSQSLDRVLSSVSGTVARFGSNLSSTGRTLSIAITAPLVALGAASLKSAKDLDANVNTLRAFTGGAEAAERRLAQLIKTSRQTPGLTTNLALTLDAQLRTAQVMESTIDRVLPAIGRLNAVSKLPDAGRFTQNLVQLVTQNFEKQDLKELVGQSPLAGQLITEIFNVDSPTNAKAIRDQAKKLGLTSVDAFFTAFAEAASKNQGLANVTESIGTRFDKFADRIQVALRPLGLAIINAIEPFIEPAAKFIESLGKAFDSLSQPVKTAIIVVAGIVAAVGPLLFLIGNLATGIAAVVSALGTIASVVAAVGLPVILAIVGAIVVEISKWVIVLGALGLAWRTNFLNIRGLVKDAATAVLDAVTRIKAVLDEATQRILPTLESITGKVLAVVTAIWERYGKTVVRVVGDTFKFVVRVTEGFLRTFSNFVDLILKLIDGDWRGAWQAFARIAVQAIESFAAVFNNIEEIAFRAIARAIQSIIRFMIAQRAEFLLVGAQFATKLIAGIVAEIVQSAPKVKDALVEVLTLAVSGVDATSIAAVLIGKFMAALKKAAAEGVTIPVTAGQDVGGDVGIGAGILRKKRSPISSDDNKGADAATRRRIRLLELEAERGEAIARQGISAENILFDQRKVSLKEFTDFQIREEELVLAKKKAVFAAERAEAEKLGKGRELALGEIRLKELRADLDFAERKNQILANRDREELEAAKAHRQALLDIQEKADDAELAHLEDFRRLGFVTAFDIAGRQAAVARAALARRKKELETQLDEAGENLEERQRITDEINKLNDESAESVRRNRQLEREAVLETAESYRDYSLAIRDAIETAKAAARDAAAIALSRLSARVFLTPKQRIERQFELDKQALIAEKRALALQIDLEEHEAIEKAKTAGALGEEILKIEKIFNERRLAESKRFHEERKKLEEDKQADLERAGPSSGRGLLGDVFADTAKATGSALAGLAATAGSVFADLSAQAGNFATILTNVFSQLGDAVGTVVENFVKFGTAGIGFKKFAVDVIASVAKMAIVKSVFEFAEAAAMYALFWFTGNPKFAKSGSEHLIAAAAYLAVGGVSAGIGRAVAGRSQSDSTSTASSAVNGGEAQPNNRNFDSGGNGPVETSSQAARDGSGGSIFGRVFARIEQLQTQTLEVQRQQMLLQGQTAQALSRIQSMRHGDALAIGTTENPAAVGRAVINHSNSDGDFNEALQRNLGFAG